MIISHILRGKRQCVSLMSQLSMPQQVFIKNLLNEFAQYQLEVKKIQPMFRTPRHDIETVKTAVNYLHTLKKLSGKDKMLMDEKIPK